MPKKAKKTKKEKTEKKSKKTKKKKLSKGVKKGLADGGDFGNPDALVVRSQSSVEMKRDKNGAVTWTIKCYMDDPQDAAEKAVEVNEYLSEEYPL